MTNSPTDERPDTRDMRVVHDVFRREYALLPALVRGVADGDAARAATVAAHHRLLSELLHIHHTGEDELLWPVLLQQAPESAALVGRMQGQHDRLVGLLGQLADAVPGWASAPDAAGGESVATVLDELRAALEEHLTEEESEVLPLCEEKMTSAQWVAIGEHGRSHVPPDRVFLVFGMMLEDAPPPAATMMLAGLPPEVQEAWAAMGQDAYADYVRRVRGDRFGGDSAK